MIKFFCKGNLRLIHHDDHSCVNESASTEGQLIVEYSAIQLFLIWCTQHPTSVTFYSLKGIEQESLPNTQTTTFRLRRSAIGTCHLFHSGERAILLSYQIFTKLFSSTLTHEANRFIWHNLKYYQIQKIDSFIWERNICKTESRFKSVPWSVVHKYTAQQLKITLCVVTGYDGCDIGSTYCRSSIHSTIKLVDTPWYEPANSIFTLVTQQSSEVKLVRNRLGL